MSITFLCKIFPVEEDAIFSHIFQICHGKTLCRLKSHKELVIELVPNKIFSWCHGSSNPWRDDLGATA